MKPQTDQLKKTLQAVNSHENSVNHIHYVAIRIGLVKIFDCIQNHVKRDHDRNRDLKFRASHHVIHKRLNLILQNKTRKAERLLY